MQQPAVMLIFLLASFVLGVELGGSSVPALLPGLFVGLIAGSVIGPALQAVSSRAKNHSCRAVALHLNRLSARLEAAAGTPITPPPSLPIALGSDIQTHGPEGLLAARNRKFQAAGSGG